MTAPVFTECRSKVKFLMTTACKMNALLRLVAVIRHRRGGEGEGIRLK